MGMDIQPVWRRVAASDVPLLIEGETGCGQGSAGAPIHAASAARPQAVPEAELRRAAGELVESELFGYERGAFTGAFTSKPGKFELAQGGTILLDEIGDMDVRLQAKLLHVLQDKECERLGGKDRVPLDVRVMAATHCDLQKAIDDGRFRADLYYRLNVVAIRVPALRERTGDIQPGRNFSCASTAPTVRPLHSSRPPEGCHAGVPLARQPAGVGKHDAPFAGDAGSRRPGAAVAF